MIDDVTRAAFADELSKIAGLKTELAQDLAAGWHGTPHVPERWLGEGLKLKPGMGMFGKAYQYASSLGGLTKHLPVGNKSLAVLGTAAMLPSTLSRHDPSGYNKSRLERLTGLAGNTLGGIMSYGALARRGIKSPLAIIGGSLLGSIAGERLLTTPFAAARRGLSRYPSAQRQLPSQTEGWRNTAPGGLTTTPDATVGQAQAM